MVDEVCIKTCIKVSMVMQMVNKEEKKRLFVRLADLYQKLICSGFFCENLTTFLINLKKQIGQPFEKLFETILRRASTNGL